MFNSSISFSIYWYFSSLQNSNSFIGSTAKDAWKCLVPCTAPLNSRLQLLWSTFQRLRSDREWITVANSGLGLCNIHLPILIATRSVWWHSRWWIIFHLPFLSYRQNVKSFSTVYRYFYGKSSSKLHSIFPGTVTLRAKNKYDTYTEPNHTHSLRIP